MKMATALLRGGGELHLVGSTDITTFPDPLGAVHRLVALADGTRTAAEITALLRGEFAGVDEPEIAAALEALRDAGLLEDYPLVSASATGSSSALPFGIRPTSFSGS